MSLTNKWVNTIFKIATGGKLFKNIVTPIGGILFLSVVTGFVYLSLFLDEVLEFSYFLSFPFDLILGFIFLFPGLILTGSCIFYFLKYKGTPVPLNPPPELVNDGPYEYSRNPMVGGLFLIFFGIGFMCNSITLTFIITPLFIILNYFELKKIEEPELEKRLGNEYVEYKKKTPMFFPKWKSFLK